MAEHTLISRRQLLGAGCLLVALSPAGLAQAAAAPTAEPGLESFLAIHADNSVTFFSGKVDLGTGLRVALPQIIAEELDVPIETIVMVEGDTARTPNQGSTAGSSTISRTGVQLRQVAATARKALLQMAAQTYGVAPEALTIDRGVVRERGGQGRSIGIGQLLGGKQLSLAIDPSAPVKNPRDYKVVGQSLPRPDLPAKCTGAHTFLQDVSVPGMLHGRVIRPAGLGARLISVDEASLAGIPDVRVVRINNFLGVVAKDEWAAVRAARALKAEWSAVTNLPGSDNLAVKLRAIPIARDEVVSTKGDAAAGLAAATTRLEQTYFWPAQSHAPLAPSCAVADVRADQATIWSGSLNPHGGRPILAGFLKLPREKVRVIFVESSGTYGSAGADDAAADAALLSQAVGAPVRVQWSRADEHGWDPKGPPQLLDLKAGLDAQGRLVAWEADLYGPGSTQNLPFLTLLGPKDAGLGPVEGMSAGALSQHADPGFDVANQHVRARWQVSTPLRPSNIRSPGKVANGWASESFTDELAVAAGKDPIAFRLEAVTDPRAATVIWRTAEVFGWTPRSAQVKGAAAREGRGFAFNHYKHSEGYFGMAIAASVDARTGGVRVSRVVCVVDCGLVINPDGFRNQVEGCIVQTLSRALHEEVLFDRSRVTSTDWVSYPILRMVETPVIETVLIDQPDKPPFSPSEAAAVPVGGALCSAIFDAVGVRLRQAPFTAARIREALRA